ncbi:helix-turn-helix domain-containing protein [Streptomyces endophyticus]|uniref:Helix-turn-helix domain-containing protein n=1 Tax=Streptomyces endophyticus TaxID=714166 RepID=A0ABU6F581_9ACTN|nr:helix-turn-helix domain-containing protein [Streptomyces endophyticus]MEB8338056.1 helix-turn-helix domain-containing protein [Streptomyces endophyticus]
MPGAAGRPTLAERLEMLFDEIRPQEPTGRRYTHDEVAAELRRVQPGLRVSGAYLSALRNGSKRNPSLDLLTALAQFFGVSASYFLDPTPQDQAEEEIALAKVGHHPQVRNLALRALELSPESLAVVTQIVERVLTDIRHGPPSAGQETVNRDTSQPDS